MVLPLVGLPSAHTTRMSVLRKSTYMCALAANGNFPPILLKNNVLLVQKVLAD
jgi:hypothetical protein